MKDPKPIEQAPAWIEDHSQRTRSGHVARRQQRIVGRHSTGANDHGVGQRPHTVQMEQVLATSHELRLAVLHRNEPVETLAEMADRHRAGSSRAADRQVQVEECVTRIVGGNTRLPADARPPRDDCRWTARRDCGELLFRAPCEECPVIRACQRVGQLGCGKSDSPDEIDRVVAGLNRRRRRDGGHRWTH